MKNKYVYVSIIACLVVALALLAARDFGLFSVNISGDKAYVIAKKDRKTISFIKKSFKDPDLRTREVKLNYDLKSRKYSWVVELTERSCGCRGVVTLNAVKVTVDPYSGKIKKREFIKEITEKDFAKKSCMQKCH